MNENKSYDDGICDTWDCIKDVARMGKGKRQRLFRETNIVKIVKEYNPWEVMRIVKTYKKQQKLKNNEYAEEITKLQTYKIHEGGEKMVLLEDVIRVLTDGRSD